MKRLLPSLLALCAWVIDVAYADEGSSLKTPAVPVIRVEKDNWRGASLNDIRKVLESAAQELMPHADSSKWDNIIVSRSSKSPIVLFKRGKAGEYFVKLNTQGNFWCQYAYQFSHELGHIIAGYKDGDKGNLWLEESLCETASLFTMRKMREAWVTSPPYPNWKDYSKHLGSYAQDRIDDNLWPKGKSVSEWYEENKDHLRKNPTDRAKNNMIAAKLLPYFEEKPKRWRAVRYLNECKSKKHRSFAKHLEDWKESCPNKEDKDFVAYLTKLFGVKSFSD